MEHGAGSCQPAGPRRVALHVPGEAPPHLHTNLGPLPASWTPRAGGWSTQIHAPLAVDRLVLSRGAARAALTLTQGAEPDPVRRARAQRRSAPKQAWAALEAGDAAADPAPFDSLRGRLLHDQGRHTESHDTLRRAVAAHLERGRLGAALRDVAALSAYLMIDGRLYREARAQLDGLRAHLEAAEHLAFLDYYEANAAYIAQDHRAALRALDRLQPALARHGAGFPMLAADAPDLRACVYGALGRHERAAEAAEAAIPVTEDACQRARIWSNVGWHRLRSEESRRLAGRPGPSTALAALAEAAPHLACLTVHDQRVFHLNRFFAHLSLGELSEAEAALADAGRIATAPGLRETI